MDRSLSTLLSSLIEIVQPHNTSYHPRTKTEAAIDRWFVGGPAWTLRGVHTKSHVGRLPFDMYTAGI
eukprot:4714422-Karenia_brevis.AAC.1